MPPAGLTWPGGAVGVIVGGIGEDGQVPIHRGEPGQGIEAGTQDFKSLEAYMLEKGDATPNVSGRQEMLENLINRYL